MATPTATASRTIAAATPGAARVLRSQLDLARPPPAPGAGARPVTGSAHRNPAVVVVVGGVAAGGRRSRRARRRGRCPPGPARCPASKAVHTPTPRNARNVHSDHDLVEGRKRTQHRLAPSCRPSVNDGPRLELSTPLPESHQVSDARRCPSDARNDGRANLLDRREVGGSRTCFTRTEPSRGTSSRWAPSGANPVSVRKACPSSVLFSQTTAR